MGGAFRTPWRRISREKAWVAWLGRVFLEKKPGLHGWGAQSSRKMLGLHSWGTYFLRKGLGRMAGALIFQEKAWVAWLGRVFLRNWVIDDPKTPIIGPTNFSQF